MTSVLNDFEPLAPPRRFHHERPLDDVGRRPPVHVVPAQAADGLAIASAVLSALVASQLLGTPLGPPAWIIAFGPVTLVVFRLRGLYRYRIRSSLIDSVAAMVGGTVITAAAMITLRSVIAPNVDTARDAARVWAMVVTALLLVRTRSALAGRRDRRQVGAGNTVIIGAGAVGHQVARRLLDRPELGLRPVGFLDTNPLVADIDDCNVPVLGASRDLEEQVAIHRVENVLFAFSTAPHHVDLDLIRRSQQLGLRVLLVPRLFEQVVGRVQLDHLGGTPVLQLEPVDHQGRPFAVKYLLDRVVAALVLVVVSPVALAIALAVRLSSPGPVLFHQLRVGLDGSEFDMLKFRSMTGSPEADGEADAGWATQIMSGTDAGLREAIPDQLVDRQTPIGRLLRRSSLDELPQLINVLRGEMSLVGPRPERAALARRFEQHVYRYDERHRVKSGMTGWAQVQGLRGNTSLADRVEWDNHYIENWTPWFDVKIILMTFRAVFVRPGRVE